MSNFWPGVMTNPVRNALKENPMTETATKKKPSIRLTFTAEQARRYYAHIGGQIGQLKADLAIRDGRASEIAEQVAELAMQQDYIAETLRKHATEG